MEDQPVQPRSPEPARSLTPGSSFRLTLLQMLTAAAVLCVAGYSLGVVHAQLSAHEGLEGHRALVGRVGALERSQIQIATVLDLLEKRVP